MSEPSKINLAALIEARRKRAPLRLADLSTNIEKPASQQAINKLLETNLTKAGFDLDKFGALLKQSDAEARQRMANFIAQSDKRSAAALDTMHRTVQDWRNSVEHLKALARADGPFDNLVVLDTATEIVVFPNSGIIPPISTHAGSGPEGNWAQFLFDKSFGGDFGDFGTIGGVEASFGFLWQNPSDRYAVVFVLGTIVLNGTFVVLSDGGYLYGNRFTDLSVHTDLFIHELWNDPPTSPLEQPGQSKIALSHLHCDSSGFFAPGAINGADLNRGFALTYEQFVMPPKSMAMFEVDCNVEYHSRDGEVQAVFRDQGRQLMCPGVWIAVQVSATIKTLIDLNGRWAYGGTPGPVISVSTTSLTIDMSAYHRPTAHGFIVNESTITVTFPDDATYTGTLQLPNAIRWSNGSGWTKV